MSQFIAVAKPAVAYVVTDSVMTDPDRMEACGHTDKLMVLPRLNAVLASRGRAGFNAAFAVHHVGSWCVDFDDLTDRARLLMARALADLVGFGVPIESTMGQEALLVGYSARRRRIEAHGLKVHDGGISHDVMGDGVIAAPWDWQRYGPLRPKLGSDAEKGMAALARQQFETMRNHVFDDEAVMIGGDIVMATVRRSSVTTSVIGRFPNRDDLTSQAVARTDHQAERAAAAEVGPPPNIVN